MVGQVGDGWAPGLARLPYRKPSWAPASRLGFHGTVIGGRCRRALNGEKFSTYAVICPASIAGPFLFNQSVTPDPPSEDGAHETDRDTDSGRAAETHGGQRVGRETPRSPGGRSRAWTARWAIEETTCFPSGGGRHPIGPCGRRPPDASLRRSQLRIGTIHSLSTPGMVDQAFTLFIACASREGCAD